LKRALSVSPISLPAFGAVSAVYAQTEEDAQRFRALGAAVQGVFGNLKFDATPDATQQAQGKTWRHAVGMPVVMFASSREGEESDFLKQIMPLAQVIRAQAATELIANDSTDGAASRRFKPLIVPRHPQRFDEVQALAESFGLRVSRRSSWPAAGPAESAEALQADVWLGDSLGEMALYYGLSDVALLGGSFAPLGGQNLIEAAACGCPVVMGPHTFNFTEAAELAEAEGAAQRVADMGEAVRSVIGRVNEPRALAKAADAGLAFAARNRGATERTLAALRGYW
jgi:3-deoxy-D-manno-octulosonic-acid transferase